MKISADDLCERVEERAHFHILTSRANRRLRPTLYLCRRSITAEHELPRFRRPRGGGSGNHISPAYIWR